MSKYLKWIIGLLIVGTVGVCHVAYSWIGFNPTDDGYHLAGSRRILSGAIPHRDFITIRPPGSFYLHAPAVAFGGEYILLASRLFVWLELVSMMWAWIFIINHYLQVIDWQKKTHLAMVFIWTLIGLVFSAHSFPMMAWHTIDGLVFGSLGLALILQPRLSLKRVGYVMIGCSPLFKQNFMALPPLVWLLTAQWRHWKDFKNSLLMAVPLLSYLGIITLAGGLPDLQLQLVTQTGFSFAAYLKPTNWWPFSAWGIAAGLYLYHPRKAFRWVGVALLGYFLFYVRESFSVVARFLNSQSYHLFHLTLGLLLYPLLTWRSNSKVVQLGLLGLSFAWVASISIGYLSPALGTGPLAMIILAVLYRQSQKVEMLKLYYVVGLLILLFYCRRSFQWMRYMGAYREPPAAQLTYDLGDVLPGAKGVRSTQHTHEVFADLKQAIELTHGRKYALVPDYAVHWMSSQQSNPLAIDWPQQTELASEALKNRIAQNLDQLQTEGGIVIVEKDDASRLANGFVPIPDNSYFIVEYVETHWTPEQETDHFILYR